MTFLGGISSTCNESMETSLRLGLKSPLKLQENLSIRRFFFIGQLDVDLPLSMKGGDLLYNSFHVVLEILNAVAVQLLNIKCKRRTLLHEESLYLCTLPCCLMTSTSCLFQGQPLTALPA